jgi:hypothetical protein
LGPTPAPARPPPPRRNLDRGRGGSGPGSGPGAEVEVGWLLQARTRTTACRARARTGQEVVGFEDVRPGAKGDRLHPQPPARSPRQPTHGLQPSTRGRASRRLGPDRRGAAPPSRNFSAAPRAGRASRTPRAVSLRGSGRRLRQPHLDPGRRGGGPALASSPPPPRRRASARTCGRRGPAGGGVGPQLPRTGQAARAWGSRTSSRLPASLRCRHHRRRPCVSTRIAATRSGASTRSARIPSSLDGSVVVPAAGVARVVAPDLEAPPEAVQGRRESKAAPIRPRSPSACQGPVNPAKPGRPPASRSRPYPAYAFRTVAPSSAVAGVPSVSPAARPSAAARRRQTAQPGDHRARPTGPWTPCMHPRADRRGGAEAGGHVVAEGERGQERLAARPQALRLGQGGREMDRMAAGERFPRQLQRRAGRAVVRSPTGSAREAGAQASPAPASARCAAAAPPAAAPRGSRRRCQPTSRVPRTPADRPAGVSA